MNKIYSTQEKHDPFVFCCKSVAKMMRNLKSACWVKCWETY